MRLPINNFSSIISPSIIAFKLERFEEPIKLNNGSIIEFRDVVDKLTPYLSLELDLPVKKEILEGGFMYRVGGKYPIKVSNQPIDIDLSFAGHDGIYGNRPERISSARLALSTLFKLGHLELTPEINFQKRLGYSYENGGIAKDRIYGGLKVVFPFDIL